MPRVLEASWAEPPRRPGGARSGGPAALPGARGSLHCRSMVGRWGPALPSLSLSHRSALLCCTPWLPEEGAWMKKVLKTSCVTCVFTLKFHVRCRNIRLPVWKLNSVNSRKFSCIFFIFFPLFFKRLQQPLNSFFFFFLFFFSSTFSSLWNSSRQILGLLDWSSNFIYTLIFYLIFELLIYAILFPRSLFCSLNFQNNFLFLFHGHNIY